MSTIIPELTTNIPSGSLTYQTDINVNFTNLLSALTAVDAALGASSAGLSFLLQEDWARRIDSGDESTGILGGAIFVDDDGNGKFRIDPGNTDNVLAVFLAGTRHHESFSSSVGFEGDLSTLVLSDGTFEIYVGLVASGETGIALEFGTAPSDLTSLHVFTFRLVVSGGGGTYVISRVRRVDRTQLFDNTLLQKMLEVPVEHKTNMQPAIFTHGLICVPYAHYLDALVLEIHADGATAIDIDFEFVNVSPILGTISFDSAGTTADTLPDRVEVTPATPYNGEAMAANTFYHLEVTSAGGAGTVYGAVAGIKVRPAWGVPVVTVN